MRLKTLIIAAEEVDIIEDFPIDLIHVVQIMPHCNETLDMIDRLKPDILCMFLDDKIEEKCFNILNNIYKHNYLPRIILCTSNFTKYAAPVWSLTQKNLENRIYYISNENKLQNIQSIAKTIVKEYSLNSRILAIKLGSDYAVVPSHHIVLIQRMGSHKTKVIYINKNNKVEEVMVGRDFPKIIEPLKNMCKFMHARSAVLVNILHLDKFLIETNTINIVIGAFDFSITIAISEKLQPGWRKKFNLGRGLKKQSD